MALVHCAWHDPDGAVPELADHPDYRAAKKNADARAALRVCDGVARTEVLRQIGEACTAEPPGTIPIVVAPALTPYESRNALSRGYAHWLADRMGWRFGRGIFQSKTMSRDFITDRWVRLAHEPEFYGDVVRGGRYVIADDVLTAGGTAASLRGFIESRGGEVICITALAAGDGSHPQISLAETTLTGLTEACDGKLAEIFRSEIGHGVECVTEQEGRFLLRCPSVDAFRESID